MVSFLLQLGDSIFYRSTNGCATRFAKSLSRLRFVSENSAKFPGWGCAINAKQIEVKFDSAVDADTAEDTDNYFVQKNSDASAVKLSTVDATATAEVQADGKTVVITTTTAIETAFGVNAGTPFNFVVDGVTNTAGKAVTKTTKTLTVSDTTAPTYVSATAKAKTSTNQITLKFSEPVQPSTGIVKVNGAVASTAAGTAANEVLVTTTANLVPGQTYNLQILNFKDYANNLLSPSTVDATVTVEGDVTAPVATSFTTVSDNQIEITFDKAMNPATVNTTNVKLLDGNLNSLAANIVSILPKTGTSNKTFVITLQNTPALPFNSSNQFTGTVLLTDSVTDAAGNKLVTTQRSITITKDTTAPALSSIKFVKADATPGAKYGNVTLANGVVAIKFTEKIAKVAGATAAGIVVIDNNGTDVTTTYVDNAAITAAAVNNTDSTELVIPLKTAVAAGTTSLTFRLPGGLVEDVTLSKNKDVATVTTVQVDSGSTVTDTTKPVVTSITGAAGNVINIAVTEANALDTASVLDLNNYRLDGAPLPAGTYAEITGAAPNFTIKLHLPAGSVAQTRTNYAVNVNGIKDKAGNVITSTAFNNVALTDDVKPELTTATLNADGTVSLGFSEDVVGAVAADFVVTLNGSTLVNAAGTSYTVAKVTSGADAGKYVVTVKTTLDDVDGTPNNGDETLYIDVDGSGTLNAGDITVSTGSFAAGGNFDLNSPIASTLKVGTIASGTPTGADAQGNTLKLNVVKTVK